MGGELQPQSDGAWIEQLSHDQFNDSPENLRARKTFIKKYGPPVDGLPTGEDYETVKAGVNVLDIEKVLAAKAEVTGFENILEAGYGEGSFLWYLYIKHRDKYPHSPTGERLVPGELIGVNLHGGPNSRISQEASDKLTPVMFMNGDVKDLKWPENTFKYVFCHFTAYHVSEFEKGLMEIRRVLQPGGELFFATRDERHLGKLRNLSQVAFQALKLQPKYSGIELKEEWYDPFDISKSQKTIPTYGFELIDSAEQIGEAKVPQQGWIDTKRVIVSYLMSLRGSGGDTALPNVKQLRKVVTAVTKPMFFAEIENELNRGNEPNFIDLITQWAGRYRIVK